MIEDQDINHFDNILNSVQDEKVNNKGVFSMSFEGVEDKYDAKHHTNSEMLNKTDNRISELNSMVNRSKVLFD